MGKLNVRVQTSLLPRGKHTGSNTDLFQASVRTINPDQTGLMAHTLVARGDLDVFWQGVDAVARTWMPQGITLPPVKPGIEGSRTCSFPDCKEPKWAHDLCNGHLRQLQRGKPLKPLRKYRKRAKKA